MGRRGYPAEFRRRALELLKAGRPIRTLATELSISEQTLYAWRRQERVDQGLAPGLTSAERAELVAARRRIQELETEVAVHRRATELLRETSDPKADSRASTGSPRRVFPCR